MKSHTMPSCAVPLCKSTCQPGVRFYEFPSNPVLRAAWLKSISRADFKPFSRSTVCSKHFKEDDFVPGLRMRLKKDSVPTIFSSQHGMLSDSDDEDSSTAKRAMHVCTYCDKQLTSESGIRIHKKKYHPEMTVVKPTGKFQFVCHLCDGECRFNKEQYLIQHFHSYHGLPNTEMRIHKCSMCSKSFGKPEIFQHYSKDHGMNLEPENVVFSSFQGFLTWKERIEEKMLCRYVSDRGLQKTKGSQNRHFICRGSVEYSDIAKGLKRKYSTPGTTAWFCPSSIKVSENKESGECSVSYIPTHVGHVTEENLSKDSSFEEYLESEPDDDNVSSEENLDGTTGSLPSTSEIKNTSLMCDEMLQDSELTMSDTDSSSSDSLEEKKIHKCHFCVKRYATSLALSKHVKAQHTEVKNETCLKFSCDLCDGERRFSKQYHLVEHMRMKHGMPSAKLKLHECCLCNMRFQKTELYEHYSREHDEKIVIENLTFPSFKKFLSWKEKIEDETLSRYTYERGVQKTKNYSHHYFQCHRSGYYIPNVVCERQLKAQGSLKINQICTSSIKLKERIIDGECYVTYISTHIGHEKEACHLNLSIPEKEFLKSKLENNVPFDEILSEVRNSFSSNSGLQRIHRLSNKDLFNLRAQVVSEMKKSVNCTTNATVIYLGQNESEPGGEN